MLTPGTLLGERYEIIEKIGAGGMSIVYKAKDNRLQRFVSIKELREEYVQDEEFVTKFRKEALSAARLSHPNIVGIYDVGSNQDLHYIVMEYVEGKTLKQVIAEKGPFDVKTVLELGIQMVSALKHAHQKKIIHRDIKPQNILMTNDGVLKVTDFGIAKAVDSSTIVATGNAIGSVHYFSPEQAKGKYVNESSDLYSCGIVLFELATKRLPFEADSHISIALKHINEAFPRPSSINPNVPQNLENLILKATAKNQADRYQNADEMLHDMRGVLQNSGYVIEENGFTEKTILLSASETQLLRESEKEPLKADENHEPKNKEDSIYEAEVGFSKEEEEDDSEVSTFYKVVARLGGVLVTLALVIVISLACVLWLPSLGKGKTYSVPKVTGMTLEQAQEVLGKSNLKYHIVQLPTNKADNGTVIEQDPAAGEAAKKGAYIELTVAISNDVEEEPTVEEVSIPDFTNKESSEVMSEITKLGLQVGETTFDYHNTVESGQVISHTPTAGAKVKSGDVVDLVISKGSKKDEKVSVPNVVGSTLDEARAKLEGMNLKLGQSKEEHSDTEAGYIIRQKLSVGTAVAPGTKVDVTISKGPKEPEATVEPEPSISPEPSDTPESSEAPEEEQPLVTVSRSFNLPGGIEEKPEYHVFIKLTLDDGTSHSIADELVSYNNFPYSVNLTGRGSGTVEVFIDNTLVYQDPITFQ